MMALMVAALMGCEKPLDAEEVDATLDRVAPEVTLPSPTLRRLTRSQYDNAIRELLGDGLVLPSNLEPDEATDGLQAIGASLTTISPRGVEQYESAAFGLAEQVFENEVLRGELVPCTPSGVVDEACAEETLAAFGRRAWRRPLESAELDTLLAVAAQAATVLDDFDAGLRYAVAAVLQSPNFLFRVELGDGEQFNDYEMATRLSFLLWNSIPDDELLDAAEAGELLDDAGLMVQAERMLEDPRFEDGIRAFFTDTWGLYELDDLTKDPTVFTHMSPEVGSSAREETLLGVVDNVVDSDGDYRDLFTTTRTFLDRKLASIYSVRAPAREGFGEAVLDGSDDRRGFLGQVSFLALQSHAVNSSATLRGRFVREVLLCQYIPPPPSDVDTSIPEPSASAATLRERVAVHLEDPYCSSCHTMMDPIGLGFEQFDGLGHYRTMEEGAVIDPSGQLDGHDFADAWGLADRVASHERLGPCLVRTALGYASGRSVTDGEEAAVDYLAEGFTFMDHRLRFLLMDLVMSDAFRLAGEVE
ncbi:MAG: DUF1592 domain-containing protein [Myxococcota bacterium]|nr:DUF1592 domain-containing protein [Myxococcota bacterium]MEC9389353.1 DUF1592 domain-containing protein [Myxococcota bacterium]